MYNKFHILKEFDMLNRITLISLFLVASLSTGIITGTLAKEYGDDCANKQSHSMAIGNDVKQVTMLRINSACQNFLNGRFWKEGVKSVVFENGEAKVTFDDGTYKIILPINFGKMKSQKAK